MLEIIEAAKEYNDYLYSFQETPQGQYYKYLSSQFKAQTIEFFKKGGTVQELVEQLSRQPGIDVERLKRRIEKYHQRHGAHIQEDITQAPRIGRIIASLLSTQPKDFLAVSITSTAKYLSSHFIELDRLRFTLLSGPRKGQEVSMAEFQEKKTLFQRQVKDTKEDLKTTDENSKKIREIRKVLAQHQKIQEKVTKKVESWLSQ